MHDLSRDRFVKRKALKASLIPEEILNGLGDGEVRDLFAYLRGRGQVKCGRPFAVAATGAEGTHVGANNGITLSQVWSPDLLA